jgi:hypothetical protein
MMSVKKRNVGMCKFLIVNGALPSINTLNNVINIYIYMLVVNYIYDMRISESYITIYFIYI